MEDNYLTPKELRSIAGYCDALNPLWDSLVGGPNDGISIEMSDGFELTVYDAIYEKVGRITWADGGAAFYPNPDKKG